MKKYRSLQYANLIYNTWGRIYISIPIPLNGMYIYFWTQLFLCHKCHVTNHSLELQEKLCHYTTNGTTTITSHSRTAGGAYGSATIQRFLCYR